MIRNKTTATALDMDGMDLVTIREEEKVGLVQSDVNVTNEEEESGVVLPDPDFKNGAQNTNITSSITNSSAGLAVPVDVDDGYDYGSISIQERNDILDELDVLSGGPQAKTLECPEPLIPFQNVIVRHGANDAIDRDMKIPKILHLSMKSRCLPRDLYRTVQAWKESLPTYSIFFHDDEAVARLIDNNPWEEFPNLHRAMKCVVYKGAMKIDVWRVLMLYKYGGVYTDIDNYPLDKFNESVIRSDLSAFFLRDGYNRPSQWFMATEPRHPIMHQSMILIVENIFAIPRIRKPKVVFVTGPHAVKGGYAKFVKNGNETMPDNLVFANNVVVTGMNNKTALKSSRQGLLSPKHGYSDIVPFNATLNVTRQVRIKMDGGVAHWQYKLRDTAKQLPRVSCKRYLELLDSGKSKEYEQF